MNWHLEELVPSVRIDRDARNILAERRPHTGTHKYDFLVVQGGAMPSAHSIILHHRHNIKYQDQFDTFCLHIISKR